MNKVILSNILILSAIVLINLTIYAYKKRRVKGGYAFTLLLLAMIIHTVGYAFELLSTSIEQGLFFLKIEYIGIAFYPVLILWFAKECTDDEKMISKFFLYFFLLMDVITFLMVYTNHYHYNYYKKIFMFEKNGVRLLSFEPGAWYYIQVIMLIFVTVYSIFVIFLKLRSSTGMYKKRIHVIMIGYIIPLLAFIFMISDYNVYKLDTTPFSYLLMSLILGYGLYFLDPIFFIPVTYEKIFNSIDEAVIVLDTEGHINNFNEASVLNFKSLEKIKVGDPLSKVIELNRYNLTNDIEKIEVYEKIYKVKSLDLGKFNGTILVLSDITLSEKAKIELKKHANEDYLTELLNRRCFMDKIKKTTKGVLAIIDIDHFKEVNDTFGHTIGDNVLKQFASSVKTCLSDYVSCRYGGEEFAIYSENKSLAEVLVDIQGLKDFISIQDEKVLVTFSAGVSEYRCETLHEAILKADKLLYKAKEDGRDKIYYE